MPTPVIVLICLIGAAALLFAVALILAAPNKKRDYSKFYGKEYAHRGLHGNGIPENSLAAFAAARAAGYGVELDVQLTADGKIVVFHDDTLERMCGDDVKIKNLTLQQLQQYRLADTDERIPLFTQVLQTLVDMPVICEIKMQDCNLSTELCEGVCREIADYRGDLCVESFSPYVVKWFRKNRPDIVRGQLSCSFCNDRGIKHFAMRHLLVNCMGRPDFIAYGFEDLTPWGFRLNKGLFKAFTVAWTARGDEQRKAAAKDFDTVIFEQNPPQ